MLVLGLKESLRTIFVSLALVLKLKSLALTLALQQVLVIVSAKSLNPFFGNLCLFTVHSFRDYLLKPISSNSVAYAERQYSTLTYLLIWLLPF